jgi:hypothetical protein
MYTLKSHVPCLSLPRKFVDEALELGVLGARDCLYCIGIGIGLCLVPTLVSRLMSRTLPGWYDLRQYQPLRPVQAQ